MFMKIIDRLCIYHYIVNRIIENTSVNEILVTHRILFNENDLEFVI